MLSVSPPQSPRLPSAVAMASADDVPGDMDRLLAKLRRSMVELILQGDDVTGQMWQMYSVFEEIFGLQKISSKHPLKPVVVGDRFSQKAMATTALSAVTAAKEDNESKTSLSSTSPSSTTNGAIITTATTTTSVPGSSSPAATATVSSSPVTTVVTSPSASSDISPQRPPLPPPQTDKLLVKNKVNQRSVNAEQSPLPSISLAASQQSTINPPSSNSDSASVLSRTSNPLLDTIGVLAGSNADSDDSDLDMVYQQLRYRGRHRRPEQVRMRTHRHNHHHHQFASSDPESTSYAGSNSIDSGYKSQCATPEVSDSLSAPEVRRSASDVSASDSSTTSGRPRSSDGSNEAKSTKIKMGTRSIKVSPGQVPRSSRYQQPPLLESSMNDVTLDHLMYLRQSLRKDRQDYLTSSSHSSLPSSSASSTVRDELSPSAITDEEGHLDKPRLAHRNLPQRQSPLLHTQPPQQQQQQQHPPPQQQSYREPHPFFPLDAPFIAAADPRNPQGHRTGRRLSAGNEAEAHAMGGSASSSDYLLSGMEFYDLDSVHDFPQRRGYVAMVEEKTRCSRIHLMTARDVHAPDRRPEPAFKKHGDAVRTPPSDPSGYGYQRRSSMDSPMSQPHRNPNPPRGADSKLTEAAIRVLEMIEDFRMEEAMENVSSSPTAYNKIDSRGRVRSNVSVTTVGPHALLPRFRRHSGSRSGMRPASTGSLISSGNPLDTRSVVSAASSYAASAEHHVYEEIMYDLVCERSDQPLPSMSQDHGTKPRNRLLPVRPVTSNVPHGYHQSPEHARITARSQKHRSNLYSIVAEHDSRNAERFLEMDWNGHRGRRNNLPHDFPA